jgi:hypothetical protein
MFVVGMGGVMAEIYGVVPMQPAPVDSTNVALMISELKASALLDGFRGRQDADVSSAAHAISGLSVLALLKDSPLRDAEINPLLVNVKGLGTVAVDDLIVLTKKYSPYAEGRHND